MQKPNSLLRHLSLAASAILLAACGSNSNGNATLPQEKIQAYPVSLEKRGLTGLMKPDGTMLCQPFTADVVNPAVGGLFSTYNSDMGFCVFKSDANRTPVETLQNLYAVGVMNEGLIPATHYGDWISLYDANGNCKLRLDPIDGYEINCCGRSVSEDRLLIITSGENAPTGGLYGAIDLNGKMVVKPLYYKLTNFQNGIAIGLTKAEQFGEEPHHHILDRDGEELAMINWANLDMEIGFHDDLCPATYADQSCLFVNTKGEVKLECPKDMRGITYFDGKLFIARPTSYKRYLALYKIDGTRLTTANYQNLLPIGSTGYFLGLEDGLKYTCIDSEGKTVREYPYKQMIALEPGNDLALIANDGSGTGMPVDLEGKPIGSTHFYKFEYTFLCNRPLNPSRIANDRVVMSNYIDEDPGCDPDMIM